MKTSNAVSQRAEAAGPQDRPMLITPEEQREILKQSSYGDAESSRETIEEIRSIASLLELASDHGNDDVGAQAAQGLAQLLGVVSARIEREYRRLYFACGVRYEPSDPDA